MDMATILGMLACIACLGIGMITGNQGISALGNFYNLIAIIITVGGSFASLLMMHSTKDFIRGLKAFKVVLLPPKFNEHDTIKNILELSNIARKEGVLALEDAVNDIEDSFLTKGILMLVDGASLQSIRSMLETELISIDNRHKKQIGFYEKLAQIAPVWGMIGSLIGFINLLKNISEVSSIGPNMAITLITTLYGLLLAYLIAVPIANKLIALNNLEITLKKVIIEGVLSIQIGENPRDLEEKLNLFLSPDQRGSTHTTSELGGE